jgi:hypothetical protein
MMGRGGNGPGMMGSGYGAGMMWGGRDRWAQDASTAESFAEGRLAFLKAELKVTSQQLPLWDKYAEAMRTNTRPCTSNTNPYSSARRMMNTCPNGSISASK